MKTIYNFRHFITSIALLLIGMNVFSQSPVTSIAKITQNGSGVYSVPVYVRNFNNVANVALLMKYDTASLVYTGISFNSLIDASKVFKTAPYDISGAISISYTSIAAISLSDSTLLTVEFTAKTDPATGLILPSVLGTLQNLTWSKNLGLEQGKCSYGTPAGDPIANCVFNDGSIAVPPVPLITSFDPVSGQWQDITLVPVAVTGDTTTIVFRTEPGKTGYNWVASGNAVITGGDTYQAKVFWTKPTSQQTISVSYLSNNIAALTPTVDIVNYYPFAVNIDATKIPQFVDPMPHFAGGLRVDAKAGGPLIVKAMPCKQIALSTGTQVKDSLGNVVTIGDPLKPNAGIGLYAGYSISVDGSNFTAPMWPARTIEAKQHKGVTVQYINEMNNVNYSNYNVLADQTLLENGYPTQGNVYTDPYLGPIPMVVHLHGGEMPSNSDGGPTAWFMPTNYTGPKAQGPGFADEASSLCTYPNNQEGTTLWYHPHDQGLTRINVYTGLAGFYFLRGENEDQMALPGFTGDDKVVEVRPTDTVVDATGKHVRTNPFYSPAGKVPTAYLPEVELAIQDRMFNEKGELYWPVAPTNPDIHPFWTPEFFGDVMTVNGKSWPYLSVAPRKYMFRMLDGCNARFLNLWLEDMTGKNTPPTISVISTEGGFLDAPVDLTQSNTPAGRQTLFIAPAERPMVIIDFTKCAPGSVFTLRNDAAAPYPTGSPVLPGLTDRIMQFVVNGNMVKAADSTQTGSDKSLPNGFVRPTKLVKITDFAGKELVKPVKTRQILLNEITGPGGPVMVSINNSHFDGVSPLQDNVAQFSAAQENPTEGTVEEWQIINTTTDAHPMHIHLTQWQLVKRQKFDKRGYMKAYADAWIKNNRNLPNYPSIAAYPGGAGEPMPYDSLNADGAIGGNPAVGPFLFKDSITYPKPEEMGWKDAIKTMPGSDAGGIGEVTTYICRFAPTDIPADTVNPNKLVYSFDPSLGPNYVWHCHIIDHEDMDMMRPLIVNPSQTRFPFVNSQPVDFVACAGDNATFGVTATSAVNMLYQWEVNVNGSGIWTDIVEGGPSPYTNSKTNTLKIYPAAIGLNTNKYRCRITNVDPLIKVPTAELYQTVHSAIATLTVNNCVITGSVNYNNASLDKLVGMKVSANNKTAVVDAQGKYTITGVVSGLQNVTVTPSSNYYVGSINSTDAGAANYWWTHMSNIPYVKFLSGDVNGDGSISSADALGIQLNFVTGRSFARAPWSFWNALTTVGANPIAQPMNPIQITVAGVSYPLDILGQVTGDFNGSFNPLAPKGETSSLELNSIETVKAGANQEVELPIRSTSAMEVGAVSLILNIPSDLVDVKDVYMKNSNSPLSYKVNGNELRIGWNSLTPVSVQAASDLIVLKLKTTSAFTEGKTIKIKMVNDPLNEIANASFKPIPQSVMNIDAIVGVNNSPALVTLNCYPNPFSGSTTMSYTLPVSSTVTLQIYNMLGVLVQSVVNDKQSAGTYTVTMDASKMKPGAYYATLRVNDGSKIVERTIKLVLNK